MREIDRPSLKERTTLRLGGKAITEILLEGMDDLDDLPQKLKQLGGSPLVLGRGSNILAEDGDLGLVIIKVAFGAKIQLLGEENDKVLVKASADTPLPKLLKYCMKNGLSGLEGLAGIPGSVGGAVAMNAGSFGTETCRHLHTVEIYSEGTIKCCKSEQIEAGYRQMRILGAAPGAPILNAIFALTKRPNSVISRDMDINFFKKRSSQPLDSWSAGSAFKNPGANLFAGRLLEEAGFRGRRMGGMAFSSKHANFLINEGNGSAGAALELLGEARDNVKRIFGVELEPEIRIIPWH